MDQNQILVLIIIAGVVVIFTLLIKMTDNNLTVKLNEEMEKFRDELIKIQAEHDKLIRSTINGLVCLTLFDLIPRRPRP